LYNTIDVIVRQNIAYHKSVVNSGMNWKQFIGIKNLIKVNLLKYYEKEYRDRHLSNATLEIYAEYAAYGIVGLYFEWFSQDSDMDLMELADVCKGLLLN